MFLCFPLLLCIEMCVMYGNTDCTKIGFTKCLLFKVLSCNYELISQKTPLKSYSHFLNHIKLFLMSEILKQFYLHKFGRFFPAICRSNFSEVTERYNGVHRICVFCFMR